MHHNIKTTDEMWLLRCELKSSRLRTSKRGGVSQNTKASDGYGKSRIGRFIMMNTYGRHLKLIPENFKLPNFTLEIFLTFLRMW